LELKWLEDFVCLARVGNFSRASEERNITQPGFSRRIRALEDWLGATLVDRSTYPITLTEYGKKFLPHAEEMLKQCLDIREDFQLLGNRERNLIRVLALHTISTSWLPSRIERVLRDTPQAHVEVVPNIRGLDEHLQTLISGLADLLIVFHRGEIPINELAEHEIQWRVLDEDMFVPICHPDLARNVDLHAEGTADIPYLAYSHFTFSEKITRLATAPVKHRLREVYTNALSGSLLSVARRGCGVAWVPLKLARPLIDEGIVTMIGDESVRMSFDIVGYRRNKPRSALFETFWDSLCAAADQR